jgi:hypothetical protein
MSKKIYVGGGFTNEQLLWILPIIFNFAKLEKIKEIIFHDKIDLNKIFIDKDLYLNFNIKFLNFSISKKIFFLLRYPVINFKHLAKMILNLKKKNLLNKKISWEISQCLHGVWDQINLRSNNYKDFSFRDLIIVLCKGFYKYELGNFLYKANVRISFLSHSVYSERFLIANFRKKNIKIFCQAVNNIHKQNIKKDTSWSDVQKKFFFYFYQKKTLIEYYFYQRSKGKGNYKTANLSISKKNKQVLKKKFNVIFLHIFRDSPFNVIDRSRIFLDYYDWIVKTLEIIKDSSEYWIIKLHPASSRWGEDQKSILNQIFKDVFKSNKLPNNISIVANEFNNIYLMKNANKIITFSGTSHLESICLGKKPIIIINSPSEKFIKNSFYKCKKISDYKRILLTPKNINLKKSAHNIYKAKVFLFIRENFNSLTHVINSNETYRKDSLKKKLNSFINVKKNLLKNKFFFFELAKMLHNNSSHTVNYKLIQNKDSLFKSK